MTKKVISKMISSKVEYIDSLSFFAEYLSQFDAEDALYELDEKVWDMATTDAKQERWLRVFSALQYGM